MSDAETPGDDATDDTDDDNPRDGPVTVEIQLDVPRRMMYDELAEAFGDEEINDLLADNLDESAQNVVTRLYDNSDRVASMLAEQAEDPQP